MFEVICVSGTPGTGKTTFAQKYSKENDFFYMDVNEVIKKHGLIEEFDEERQTNVIDIIKLNQQIEKEIELLKKENKFKGVVIDSHLSHYLPTKVVQKVIVTKCSLKELKKRLEKRRYSKEKVRENLDAEIFDVCRIEALVSGHTVEVINTD